MEETQVNSESMDEGSDIEITEEQWTMLKELGGQLGDMSLSEKLKKGGAAG